MCGQDCKGTWETEHIWQRQDSRVKGLKITSSHKNTKITTNCWRPINKIDWKVPKKTSYIQRHKRSHIKIVGGVLSWYKQSSQWVTHRLENNYIAEALLQEGKFGAPHWVPMPGGSGIGRRMPWSTWHWRPVRLKHRSSTGLRETHRLSCALDHRTKQGLYRNMDQAHWEFLEDLFGEQG